MAARKPEYILNYEIAQMKFATARGLVCRVDGCSLPAISGPDERRRDGGQLCHGHSLPVQDHVYDERAAFTKFRDFLNVCPGIRTHARRWHGNLQLQARPRNAQRDSQCSATGLVVV